MSNLKFKDPSTGNWTTIAPTAGGVPSGGTAGQVLKKTSGGYGWSTLTASDVGALPTSYRPSTQQLNRPDQLNGLNDVTLQSLVNTVRANRLAFLPADQIIIEKTTDGGATWQDAERTDYQKTAPFSEIRSPIPIPLLNGVKSLLCGLRITITAGKYNVPSGTAETDKYSYWNSTYFVSTERYCNLKEMYFWVNSNSDTIGIKVERAAANDSDNWQVVFENNSWGMTGWSGCDYIRFPLISFGGNTNQLDHPWNFRLTFMTCGPNGSRTTLSTTNTTSQQFIQEIRGYGDSVWSWSNNYMFEDHLYAKDTAKNAIFPANIYPTTSNTQYLGVSNKKWKDIYTQKINGVDVKNLYVVSTAPTSSSADGIYFVTSS